MAALGPDCGAGVMAKSVPQCVCGQGAGSELGSVCSGLPQILSLGAAPRGGKAWSSLADLSQPCPGVSPSPTAPGWDALPKAPSLPSRRHRPQAAATCASWVCLRSRPCCCAETDAARTGTGRGFSAALGLKGGESSLSWIAGIFFFFQRCCLH